MQKNSKGENNTVMGFDSQKEQQGQVLVSIVDSLVDSKITEFVKDLTFMSLECEED